MENAPVVVFGYNRCEKLYNCLKSLMDCDLSENTDVFVYADGAKNDTDIPKVMETRNMLYKLKEEHPFHLFELIEREHNLGLGRSVITGVTEVLEKYGRIIVVEDDLLLSKDFLRYMNGALEFYNDKKMYGSISAYTYPLKNLEKYDKDIYAMRKGECWGWATWWDRWKNVDWDLKDFDKYLADKRWRKGFANLEVGLEEQLIEQHAKRLDAWAARWCFHLYNNDLLTVYPKVCRAINVGTDGSGANCSETHDFDNLLNNNDKECMFEDLGINHVLEKEVSKRGRNNGISIRRIIRRCLTVLSK